MPLLLAAPDKFRGTATAADVAAAMADAARESGWTCELAPVSDGGDGLLDCLGGANRESVVRGPTGVTISAGWRLEGDRAVIEMARASGLALLDAPAPLAATTYGTGELIRAAIEAGAREIVVGVGGSASTDGGAGALEALGELAALHGHRVLVAADVTTRFLDAARVFAPQKGATEREVELLAQRLRELGDEYGPAVTDLPGSGAAGGLAGGLAAAGARIVPGFALVNELLGLPARVSAADLVLTGEGRFDATSRLGKATGGVLDLCRVLGVPAGVVAGVITDVAPNGSAELTARYGGRAARSGTLACVRAATAGLLHRASAEQAVPS